MCMCRSANCSIHLYSEALLHSPISVCIFWCVCVCMCECVYVCMSVWVCEYVCIESVSVCMWLSVYVSLSLLVCMWVCVWDGILSVEVHGLCMWVCMCVCMGQWVWGLIVGNYDSAYFDLWSCWDCTKWTTIVLVKYFSIRKVVKYLLLSHRTRMVGELATGVRKEDHFLIMFVLWVHRSLS